jgi:pimeloyl-ACP methyl ester carboxylesterase
MQSLLLPDGRRLCVRRWRNGADPVVVLHGLLDSSEGWTDLCERISAPGIAFDLPGFGHSDPSQRGSIHGYAQDVAEGLEILGVDRFTLIGHSLGGAVAASLVELLPSQVSTLVLLAPAGFGRIHLAEAASIPGVRNVVQATLPLVLSSRRAVTAGFLRMVTNGQAPERDVVERITNRAGELVAGAREGTRAVVDAGRDHDAFHRRRINYDGPVFAVWGDNDRLVPVAHRHGVKAAFPQARIQVWYEMGHHPLSERFDDLLALVTKVTAPASRSARRKTARQSLNGRQPLNGRQSETAS